MVNQSATAYFHKLSELLLSVQVTDEHGVALSLDEGVSKAVEMILSVESVSRKIMLIGNGGSAAIASTCKMTCAKRWVYDRWSLTSRRC